MKQLTILLLLLCSQLLSAQPVAILNDRCKSAYQEIIALRFENASVLLEKERSENPDNVFVPYLENYIDFLGVFISEDEALFKKLEENKSPRIDQIRKLDKNNPYRNYFIGNINLQWAVTRLKFNEYFTAAFEINRAYRSIAENAENHPDFLPNQITLGILHIMIGLVPDKYHWLLNLVNMEGDVAKGKYELKQVLNNTFEIEAYEYLREEVLFYFGFVELNIKPDKDELTFILSELEQKEKNNLLLSYLTINILMRTGNNNKVMSKLEHLPSGEAFIPFIYLDYLKGESYLRKLNKDKALQHYLYFAEKFKGKNFIKDAYRKIAWIALLENDTNRYKSLMRKVIDKGYADVGQDNDALREAKREALPNIDLIKARLLFDGGYYNQADRILNMIDKNKLNKNQNIELAYRHARVYHELGDTENAIYYYNKTIEIGKDIPRYFAGNSALKLGELYESQTEYQHAAFYYKTCLQLSFEEYETGIHSKAKAGLKRVSF